MQTLPQDKESYGSDTSHDRKRQLLGGRGVLSLRSFVSKALPLFLFIPLLKTRMIYSPRLLISSAIT